MRRDAWLSPAPGQRPLPRRHPCQGAVPARLCVQVLALRRRTAPPTCNLERPDPPLLPGLVGAGAAVPLLPDGHDDGGAWAALCNSFGFGGTNASLLFTDPPTGMARR